MMGGAAVPVQGRHDAATLKLDGTETFYLSASRTGDAAAGREADESTARTGRRTRCR